MLAPLPLKAKKVQALIDLLRPDLLVDGREPEQRVVFSGISWERYLALDKDFGDDRPSPRFYYLNGELEIMSTSTGHERINTRLSGFIEDYLLGGLNIEVDPHGQATMRLPLKQAGAEPDASWCLHENKTSPDIVLEIALTSGGISKLDLYQRFGVPEVWIRRQDKLEVHLLRTDGSGYAHVPNSRLLPDLDVELLERCVKMSSWREARLAFRAGLAAGT